MWFTPPFFELLTLAFTFFPFLAPPGWFENTICFEGSLVAFFGFCVLMTSFIIMLQCKDIFTKKQAEDLPACPNL